MFPVISDRRIMDSITSLVAIDEVEIYTLSIPKQLPLQSRCGHRLDMFHYVRAERLLHHGEVCRILEIGVKRVIPEPQHLRGADVPGRERKHFVRVLRESMPLVGQAPARAYGDIVQLRSRVGHRAVEVGELAVEVDRQVERLLHSGDGVVGKAEDVVPDHPYARVLDRAHDPRDVLHAHLLGGAVPDVRVGGLDAQGEPVDPRLLHFRQVLLLHRVHPRVDPDVEVVSPLEDEVHDGHEMPLVEHE